MIDPSDLRRAPMSGDARLRTEQRRAALDAVGHYGRAEINENLQRGNALIERMPRGPLNSSENPTCTALPRVLPFYSDVA